MDTYYTWPSAVKALNNKVAAIQPLAGPGISVEKTAAGHRISLRENNSTIGYYGPFMLTAGNNTVNVSDGSGILSQYAGYAMVNGTPHLVETLSTDITGSGFLCLTATLDDSGNNATFDIELKESPVSSDTETAVYPLGYIRYNSDENSITINQFNHNLPQMWIIGNCANSPGSNNES